MPGAAAPLAAPSVGPAPGTECWVFDVDGCLVDSLTGGSLRPGARGLIEHVARSGGRVVLWSAGGEVHARARAEAFGLGHLVSGYFSKDGRDAAGAYRTAHLPVRGWRTVFVDDHPEDLAGDLEVLAVSPYLSDDPHDRGLRAASRRAGLPWPEP